MVCVHVHRWWAERYVGLAKIYQALKAYSERYPDRAYFQPSQLLADVVESGSTVVEELYFRKLNTKKKQQ